MTYEVPIEEKVLDNISESEEPRSSKEIEMK